MKHSYVVELLIVELCCLLSTRENLCLPEVDRTDMRLEVPRYNQRVNYLPMVVKCQVYLRTTLCSNMKAIMTKPWLAQVYQVPRGIINTPKSWFKGSTQFWAHISVSFWYSKVTTHDGVLNRQGLCVSQSVIHIRKKWSKFLTVDHK